MQTGYVVTSGIRLFYLSEGAGPLVLLCHGFPEHSYSWRHQLTPLAEDGFRAVGDICSHAHSHLNEGEVDMDFATIECPKHGSTFDLDTGKPRSLPATMPVPLYNVKVEGDEVKVEIPDG